MGNDSRINAADAADATVVDEVPAQPQIDPPLPYENLALMILLVLLSGAVFALAHTASAHASLQTAAPTKQAKKQVKSALPAPVLVAFPSVEAIRIAPAQTQDGNITSFDGTLSSAQKIRLQAERLTESNGKSTNIPPVGSRLTIESYNTMRTYLARKEDITEANDVHDVLLKAGYTLPPGIAAQQSEGRDHVAFAREVVNSLVKDEVESFLHKVNVVSKVGAYAAQ